MGDSARIDLMSDRFRQWLADELTTRQYSHRAFAKRIGVSQTFVSRVLSGEKAPSLDFLLKVAAALDLSPVLVLTKADILPPEPPDADPALTELSELIRSLSPDQRLEVIRYIKFLRHK